MCLFISSDFALSRRHRIWSRASPDCSSQRRRYARRYWQTSREDESKANLHALQERYERTTRHRQVVHDEDWHSKDEKKMVRMQIKINWPFIYHFSRISLLLTHFTATREQRLRQREKIIIIKEAQTKMKMSKRSQRPSEMRAENVCHIFC